MAELEPLRLMELLTLVVVAAVLMYKIVVQVLEARAEAVQAERATTLARLELPTEVVAVVELVVMDKPILVALAVRALLLLDTQTLLERRRQQQDHPQLQSVVAIVFTSGLLLVQLHSEAKHESFCKS